MVAQNKLVLETNHGCGVIELILNRPRVLNCLDAAMYLSAAAALNRHARTASTRIIVLTGAGNRSFCSGMDLKDIADVSRIQHTAKASRVFMNALMDCPKIVIAACFGSVRGIGVTLMMHCDVAYASEDSTFATPFSSIGIVPEFGSSMLFPFFLGQRLTTELLLKGEAISPQELRDAGCLIVVPSRDRDAVVRFAVEEAVKWSKRMPSVDQWQSVLEGKHVLREPLRVQLRIAMNREFEVIDREFESGRTSKLVTSTLEDMAQRKSKL